MKKDELYLVHYGVPGMKWGIRRGVTNALLSNSTYTLSRAFGEKQNYGRVAKYNIQVGNKKTRAKLKTKRNLRFLKGTKLSKEQYKQAEEFLKTRAEKRLSKLDKKLTLTDAQKSRRQAVKNALIGNSLTKASRAQRTAVEKADLSAAVARAQKKSRVLTSVDKAAIRRKTAVVKRKAMEDLVTKAYAEHLRKKYKL